MNHLACNSNLFSLMYVPSLFADCLSCFLFSRLECLNIYNKVVSAHSKLTANHRRLEVRTALGNYSNYLFSGEVKPNRWKTALIAPTVGWYERSIRTVALFSLLYPRCLQAACFRGDYVPHGTKTMLNALLICFTTEITNNLSWTRNFFALNVGTQLVKRVFLDWNVRST